MAHMETPYSSKLRCACSTISRMLFEEKTRMKNSWEIRYYDETGERIPPHMVKDSVLVHAGELVAQGYSKGIEDDIKLEG